MAKKEVPKQEPAVSNIPMPISDNPLVIDLPDGQKLVVGKLDSGSVIEVATWRGTGRPDSRTNRLMLGMSTSQGDSPSTVKSNSASVQHSNNVNEDARVDKAQKFTLRIPKIGAIALKIPTLNFRILKKINLGNITALVLTAKNKLVEKSKDIAPVESVAELDIEKWLINIKEEAEKKVESAYAERKSVSPSKSRKKSTSTHNKSLKKRAK